MRALLLELRPAALTEAWLGDLLRQLAEAVTGRARLPVAVTVDGRDGRDGLHHLPPDVQIALYRIAQEALNNTAKHAGATRAEVRLRFTPEQVELHIGDDGCGFDPATVPAGHLGVGIMRERAGTIGAALQIDSRTGRGTQVLVTWRGPSGSANLPP
jgi:signal transduction histidine kinase